MLEVHDTQQIPACINSDIRLEKQRPEKDGVGVVQILVEWYDDFHLNLDGHNIFWKKKEPKLRRWVEQYISSRSDVSSVHAEYLFHFMDMCDKDLSDITADDVGKYITYIDTRYNTIYHRVRAVRSLSCFFRHYRAIGHKYLPKALMKIPSGS